jgi:hypothetical protein
MPPSNAYFAALEDSKRIHEGKSFTGKFLRPHAIFIKEIIDRLGCKTVLDYGCGKGQQYEWVIPSTGQTIEQFWGVPVTKYDPAYPPFVKEPEGKFDLVICTQTLRTIPLEDRGWVIDRLYSHAAKALYISERLGFARKSSGEAGAAWERADWIAAIARDSRLEVILATRETLSNGEKITSHVRTIDGIQWAPVIWPKGTRFMNYEWRP